MYEYEIEAIGDYIFKVHNSQGVGLLRARRRRQEQRLPALPLGADADEGRRPGALRLRARLQVLRLGRHARVPDQRQVHRRSARAVRHLREAVQGADDLDQAERPGARHPQGRRREDGRGDGRPHLHQPEVQGSGRAVRRQLPPTDRSATAGSGRAARRRRRRQPRAHRRHGSARRQHARTATCSCPAWCSPSSRR